jgi:hypothetical protein
MSLSTRFLIPAAGIAVAAMTFGGLAATASAAPGDPPTLGIDVAISDDGTPDWDADDTAGNDSGPNNGVVRVNDTVTYRVQYAVNGEPGENVTFSLALPKGMEITELPGFCQAAGSSITPATAGEPTLPLSATSIDEFAEQTLVCNVGPKQNATDSVFVTAKVLNLVHNGATLAPIAATITADGVVDPVAATTLPEVTASSRLKWDISKNHTALVENSGYLYGPDDRSCPWDTATVCKATMYTALLFAPAGGKGAMPAIGDITFTDDLTAEALYPTLTAAEHDAINADLDMYGSRIVSCTDGTDWAVPAQEIGGSQGGTAVNSVRDSGDCAVVQAGPGQVAEFTMSNADTSLRTYPTEAIRPVGMALPSGSAYAVVVKFVVYTPTAVIRDFGVESQNTWSLSTRNAYTELDINGFTDQDSQSIDDQPSWNDYRTTTPIIRLTGTMNKFFTGLPGELGNTSGIEFSPGFSTLGQGPAGAQGGIYTGGVTVAETQRVASALHFVGSFPSAPGDVSWMMCDAWDPTKLNLDEGDYALGAGSTEGFQLIPSGGEAVWLSGYNNALTSGGATYAASADQAPTIQVEYSAAIGGSGAASECGDAQGPWYDSPEDVPGSDLTLAADGVYTAVARVRVHVVLPAPVATNSILANGVRGQVSIALRVADADFATGAVLPNWAGVKSAVGVVSMDDMLDESRPWTRSAYDPGTDRSNGHTGSLGDRLILAHAQARIDKQVRKGDTGTFSNTPPNVTGGDLVQYQLSPSLTSGAFAPGIFKDIWVEDCLPGSQVYASASITPSVVSVGSTPADAQRPACAADETYIRWVLPDHEVNTVVEPIILSVEVSPTAADGAYDNTVVVWAEDDASTLAQRSDNAQIQIANIAGVKLEKVALTPVVQNNRDGQTADELNRWAVRVTNTLPSSEASGIQELDMIDVLPKQGVDGTAFSGTFGFVSAAVTDGGPTVAILYTAVETVNQDPADTTNSATGSTAWCDAPTGGTLVIGVGSCPTDAAEVTGLRVTRPGPFASGESVAVELAIVGVGNTAGDTYVNRVFADAEGLTFPVGPILRSETVVSSAVGDTTWWDANQNGAQDDGEPAAPSIPVTIVGTDDLGNAVSLTTTSDADGHYAFDHLRSSDASGYTLTFGTPAGGEFTEQHTTGVDAALDSNADVTTGETVVVLPANTVDPTIDAGYIAFGALSISKVLDGPGVEPFAYDDELTFQVVCEFNGAQVVDEEIVIEVDGRDHVLTEPIEGIPAGASCTITETGRGDADDTPAPVTVTIPQAGTVTDYDVVASLTNRYSAGTIEVTKTATIPQPMQQKLADQVYEMQVTCQVEEGDLLVTVASGVLEVQADETVALVDPETGEITLVPLGAHCFVQETETGGAAEVQIEQHDYETGVVVTTGDAESPQLLEIAVHNVFECTDVGLCTMQRTGAGISPIMIGGLSAAALLLAGLGLLAVRRRRRA